MSQANPSAPDPGERKRDKRQRANEIAIAEDAPLMDVELMQRAG